MTNPRLVSVAQARQGGFSTHQLPAAVQYEGNAGGWLLLPTGGQDAEAEYPMIASEGYSFTFVNNDAAFDYDSDGGPGGNAALLAGDNTDTYESSVEIRLVNSFNPSALLPCTFEAMVRLGTTAYPSGVVDNTDEDATWYETFAQIYLAFAFSGGGGIDGGVATFIRFNDGDLANADNAGPWVDKINSNANVWNGVFQDHAVGGEAPYDYDSGTAAVLSVSHNTYYHVAVVVTDTATSIYFAGQRRNYNTTPISLPDNSIQVLAGLQGHATRYSNVLTSPAATEVGRLSVHGVRFTPGQALYTGASFTPPTSITELA